MSQDDLLISMGNCIANIARSSEDATPSIQFLEAIDNPINTLCGLAKTLGGLNKLINAFAESIDNRSVVECQYIDPDDEAIKATKGATLFCGPFCQSW